MPKPPRCATVPVLASTETLQISDNARKRSNQPKQVQPESQRSSKAESQMGLSKKRKSPWDQRSADQSQKSLRILHDRVVKSPAAPVIARKGSPTALKRREAPQFSFLSSSGSRKNETAQEPSSSYESYDLPSPSDLIDLTDISSNNHLRSNEINRIDMLPMDFTPLRHRSTGQDIQDPLDGAEYLKMSGQDVRSPKKTIEAIDMSKSSSPAKGNPFMSTTIIHSQGAETPQQDLPGLEPTQDMTRIDPQGLGNVNTDHEHLSFRRLEKGSIVADSAATHVGAKGIELAPKATIGKENVEDAAPKQSGPNKQEASKAFQSVNPNAAVIKSKQPAWVYNFDPDFIAEYQDFVQFV